MSLARIALLPFLAAAVIAPAAERPSGLPRSSPFVPAGTAGAPAEAAAEAIEFSGVSTIGQRTDLIFHDKTKKRNHWIAPGETQEGISVVSYDEQRQQVVVTINNGAEKTLALRKAAKSRGTPRPVAPQPTGFNVPTAPAAAVATTDPIVITPGTGAGQAGLTFSAAPAAPAAPESPETTRVRQETEARMLVSDLLEIGMAQRKAYEEAQRKAASGDTSSAPAAEPPK